MENEIVIKHDIALVSVYENSIIGTQTSVFNKNDAENILLEIYRKLYTDWKPGDKIVVMKERKMV